MNKYVIVLKFILRKIIYDFRKVLLFFIIYIQYRLLND